MRLASPFQRWCLAYVHVPLRCGGALVRRTQSGLGVQPPAARRARERPMFECATEHVKQTGRRTRGWGWIEWGVCWLVVPMYIHTSAAMGCRLVGMVGEWWSLGETQAVAVGARVYSPQQCVGSVFGLGGRGFWRWLRSRPRWALRLPDRRAVFRSDAKGYKMGWESSYEMYSLCIYSKCQFIVRVCVSFSDMSNIDGTVSTAFEQLRKSES